VPGESPQGADAEGETSGMKIICAIDGSRHSQWALGWLPRVCSPDDSSLLLVHAVDLTQFKSLSKRDRKTRLALVNLLDCSLESAARVLEWAELKASSCVGIPLKQSLASLSGSRLISSSSGREG
jgi:hypothetical protein